MLKTRRLIILLLILFFIFTYYLIKNFSNKNVYNLEAVADEINLSQNIPKDEISLSIEYVYEDLVVIENGQTFGAVSYTHLTLPTIYSV